MRMGVYKGTQGVDDKGKDSTSKALCIDVERLRPSLAVALFDVCPVCSAMRDGPPASSRFRRAACVRMSASYSSSSSEATHALSIHPPTQPPTSNT